MAVSLLMDAGLSPERLPNFDPRIVEIAHRPSASPVTSSAGRLFDGVSALLGIAPKRQSYEGEAAARLEAMAEPTENDAYPLPRDNAALDTRALTRALLDDDVSPPRRAARFINGLADGLAQIAIAQDVPDVVLSGGCMVNRLLVARLVRNLERAGRRVLLPRLLPPGDGGISAGQAAVAACGNPENFR